MASKVRISLSRNTGKSRGKVVAVMVVEPTFCSVAKAACNKLKFSAKQSKSLRLFVAEKDKCVELFKEMDCSTVLKNGDIIAVSTGEDYIRTDGFQTISAYPSNHLVPPPPYPSNDKKKHQKKPTVSLEFNETAISNGEGSILSSPSLVDSESEQQYPMNGEFPIFTGSVLNLIKAAIDGNPSFFMKDRGEFVSFDYKTTGKISQLFPCPLQVGKEGSKARYQAAIRRECRGLLVCRKTGEVIARRFHKFWNVDELEESSSHEVNLKLQECFEQGSAVTVTEKLDGSLCSPFQIKSADNEVLSWALRTSTCSTVASFVTAYDRELQSRQTGISCVGYTALATELIQQGITPLFEWCDVTGTVGVIHHNDQSLTLLTGRHMSSGMYLSRSELISLSNRFGVPLVHQENVDLARHDGMKGLPSSVATNPCSFMQNIVADWIGKEGVVLTLGDHGELGTYKMKSQWYVSIAAASKVNSHTRSGSSQRHCYELIELLKLRPNIEGVPMHLIWSICIASLEGEDDDSVSLCRSKLLQLTQPRENDSKGYCHQNNGSFNLFERYMMEGITLLVDRLIQWRQEVLATMSNMPDPKHRKQCLMEHASLAVDMGWTGTLVTQALKIGHPHDSVSVEPEESIRNCVEREVIGMVGVLVGEKSFPVLHQLLGVEWLETGHVKKWECILYNPRKEIKHWDNIAESATEVDSLSLENNQLHFDGRITSKGVQWYVDCLSEDLKLLSSLMRTKKVSPDNASQSASQSLDSYQKTVVIMRGLPGSGKSCFANMIMMNSGMDISSCICSADHYFENGADVLNNKQKKNMTKEEVYAKCFKKEKLSSAHAKCRQSFDEALSAGIDLIIVDNTSLQLKEYAYYKRKALDANYKCIIVELARSSTTNSVGRIVSDGYLFSRHGISAADFGRMKGRWEKDSSAIVLQSWQPS